MEWLIGILRDFEQAGPVTQITTALAVVTALLGAIAWLRAR